MTAPVAIPMLPHGFGSWICTSPSGEVREFFTRANAEKAAQAGWRVEAAIDYLHRLNGGVE